MRLLKVKRRLSIGEAILEIIMNDDNLSIITSFSNGEKYKTIMPKDKATKIIRTFSHDYESMADHIDIIDGKLVILKPNK